MRTCADCHDPDTMQLRLTRPALINALADQGLDWTEATRQEMRTYVCAQCHVEYYFRGEAKELVFPWSVGTEVEDIEQHYDEYGFTDWEHAITAAPMIKIQHPEFEMFTSSTHFAAGVSCADCHMPYVREGGVKVSDHWVRSPLDNLNNACQACHRASEEELEARILTVQGRTKDLMESLEDGIADCIEAIATAMDAGVPDEALVEARELHRAAQLRWDFVDAENSMGFHSPQEAVRVLGHAADLARQAELSAVKALVEHSG
jgi:nitrite reductase (cytochrome c-552)